MQVIDRRLNPKSKSLGNRQHFIRRAKAEIREAVNEALKKRKVSEVEGSERISIRSKSLREPTFTPNRRTGTREFVLPGNKDFSVGDVIQKPPPGAGGSGSKGSPDGSGEDDFVFTLKGPMFATNRRDLGEGAPSVERFVNSGIDRLGSKLGPINWQFMDTKKFEAENFECFLRLLPPDANGVPLRHAVEVRHESFATAEFVALARKYRVAIVVAAHETYPQIADLTAPFVYARWQTSRDSEPLGYPDTDLTQLAAVAKRWAKGEAPDGLTYAADPKDSAGAGRDVFLFMISGHKERNPVAALSLIERAGRGA